MLELPCLAYFREEHTLALQEESQGCTGILHSARPFCLSHRNEHNQTLVQHEGLTQPHTGVEMGLNSECSVNDADGCSSDAPSL